MKYLIAPGTVALVALLAVSCSGNAGNFAYTGRMDVDPVTISSQTSGVIETFDIHEGDTVQKGELLGEINADRLEAQRKQQVAQLAELDIRRGAAEAQISQARAQLSLAQETLAKTEKLLTQGGATGQRRDELSTQVQVDQASLIALQSNYKLISAQEDELRAGMDITDISIRDARILSPISGVVLNKFHYSGELAAVGTPMVELADLSVMTVEIYVPLSVLGSVTIGKQTTVSASGVMKDFLGTVYWVSSQAEFTPKTILTRETRTTLVYAVKIRVPNPNGVLKIGMPVDVRL
ncbi:MAG TPA: efflux RND transporter periplasmic adaptor subunit [Spirochaetia bacterium]|nr:efflux RND transporter periplasmic adaptor subunit [Spirochaetia bacterium]